MAMALLSANQEGVPMYSLQKTGGLAALAHAAAYVVGMVLGVVLIFPIMSSDRGQYLAFIANNQALMYLWNLISYWGSAITLVVMVLALHERLKVGSPALAPVGAAFGLIWAGLIIASANLMLRDIGVVASLYGKDMAQAGTTWLALEAVENGIVSGNELVGSLWVLLVSLAALRTGRLSRLLSYLGVAISSAGILTIVPSLSQAMIMVFGPGMIVWSLWLGIYMLRGSTAEAAQDSMVHSGSMSTPGAMRTLAPEVP
jgi:hypothetical protein